MTSHRRSVLSLLSTLAATLLTSSAVALSDPPGGFEGDVFTAARAISVRHVLTAEMSPDGSDVAFTVSQPRRPFDDEEGGAWVELFVMSRRFGDQNRTRPFVSGEVNVSGVQWTPDGKGISFLTKRGDDEHRSLYVIPRMGGEARRVLAHHTGIGSYAWRPDGRAVAFTARDEKDKELERLAKQGLKAEVYEEQDRPVRLFVAEFDWQRRAHDPEEVEPQEVEIGGTPAGVVWHPDGKLMAVPVAPSPRIDDLYMYKRIKLVDVATGEVIGQVENPGKLGKLAFSPDGKWLAMLSAETINDPSTGRLLVAPADGGPLKNLIPDYEGDVVDFAWQNDETIMYVAHEGAEALVAEVNYAGDRKVLAPAGERIYRGISLSKDGQSAALRADAPTHGREVFLMTHDAQTPRRMTNSNPWLEDLRLAKQEVVRYQARDGVEIEGVLVYPLDYEQGERYPLIIVVHGGPEAHFSNGWVTRYSDPGQFGAARGFAVFYPNYRGSTGRGVEFSMMSQRDYAGPEFDDLVDAITHLDQEMELVDPDRVGITGGSYGGYASAWAATRLTEHFAASVMFVGISEQISKFGTTDIPNEMYLVHARVWPWEDWDFYDERSPVRYAEQARTPILILHGKEDTRVHPSQSMVLYRYLKTLGNVPVRLVWYPGEGHGNRKTPARYDYCLRLLRWMEHYLDGEGGDPPPVMLDYPLDPGDNEEDEGAAEAA